LVGVLAVVFAKPIEYFEKVFFSAKAAELKKVKEI